MERYNVAQTMAETAARMPFRPAILFPSGRDPQGRAKFVQLSFQQLGQEVDRCAYDLSAYGIQQGDRVLVMVRPSIELMAVVFALIKMGAVPVLIDPGMGRKAFRQCVSDAEPHAFIGISPAHLLRLMFPKPFQTVKHVITVGRRWFWGGATLDQIRSERRSERSSVSRDPFPVAPTTTEDEGVIAFTSGSTGIPKGVIYLHGMFRAQIRLLRDELGVEEGEVALPCLYIFALFYPALGVTVVFPDMDATKPAEVNPAYLVEAIQTHGVTNSFGSPTIWKRVGQYCLENDIKLPSFRRIVMAGAPVPPALIKQFSHILEGGDVFTPFGATEALPITMMTGREILNETAELSEQGKGMCVGRPTCGNTIRVIQITEDPIPQWDESLVLRDGEIGEIVVKGPVVTRTYLNRPLETARSKIVESMPQGGDEIWHRMGDLGYFDEKGRLWFCGRKSHRVATAGGLLFPVPCEAIFNRHPDVFRTALVGVGAYGQQRPVLVVELKKAKEPRSAAEKRQIVEGLLALGAEHEQTRPIRDVLFHPSFPVDVRHNVKIQRHELAGWAARRLAAYPPQAVGRQA